MHQALYGPERNPAPPAILNLGFVELTTDAPQVLGETLGRLGFSAVGTHRARPATLFRQGTIHILVSADHAGYARQFRNKHATSACAFALRVDDAPAALEFGEAAGAHRYRKHLANELDVNIPALVGPGHLLVYLVDEFGEDVFQQLEFKPASNDGRFSGDCGLTAIEQFTLQVSREYADSCVQFYRNALYLGQAKNCLPPWNDSSRTHQCLTLGGNSACIDIQISDRNAQADTGQLRVIHVTTEDIGSSVKRLRAQQIEFVQPPGESSAGNNRDEVTDTCIDSVTTGNGDYAQTRFRARTVPILGNICLELVESPAHQKA